MNLDDVIKNQSDLLQKAELKKSITSMMDNLNEEPKMVKGAIADAGDMGKMLDNFIQFSQREEWSKIENKIYDILYLTETLQQKSPKQEDSCVENLKNMLTILKGTPILASIYKWRKNYNLVTKYGSDIDNLLAVKDKNNKQEPQMSEIIPVPSRPSSFLDGICCSICTDEPVLYSAKDINSKKDLYREPKNQKKDKNDEQELINFNTNISISNKYNINNNNNIGFPLFGEGTFIKTTIALH